LKNLSGLRWALSLGRTWNWASHFARANASGTNQNPFDLCSHQGFKALNVGVILRAGFDIRVADFVAADLLFFTENALCHNLKAP
jgi:hypothetical protein